MRRAKIVATLGPATPDVESLRQLLERGVDVARLNFSHGSLEDHARTLERLRQASELLGQPVAVLQDLQGPKIRTGPLAAGKVGVLLEAGHQIAIATDGELRGDASLISTSYPHLAEDVHPGDRLLLDDGLIELRVLSTDGVRVRCEVTEGGVLREHKGINLPGVALRAEAMGDKDRADLRFGLAHGVDYVALSFVRSGRDVVLCRKLMEEAGRVVPIIAKIEKPEALDRLEAIVEAADGIMVARGDLGVEILPERVPGLQKEILRKANAAAKPAIIATQMLESMIEHPRPTRAEASDVANAVWDGADAVMLSGESASGRHPLLAVEMMDRIVREAESHSAAWSGGPPPPLPAPAPFPEVVAATACRAAHEAGAMAIACFTRSGSTARLLSKNRPHVPVIAFTPDQELRRRLSLLWGVVPKVMEPVVHPDQMARRVSDRLVEEGMARPGDRLVLVHGSLAGVAGRTNSIRLHRIPFPGEQRAEGE